MATPNNADYLLTLEKPWKDNKNACQLATTITLRRNIENFLFPGKMSPDKRQQTISLLGKHLLEQEKLSPSRLFRADDLTPQHKEFLTEHFLLESNLQPAHAGEAFLVDDTGELLATINLANHLELHTIDCQGEIEKNWNKLVTIETSIGESIKFAYSTKYGFLTSDPFTCGTAMTMSIWMQLPALIHSGNLEKVLEAYSDNGCNITGIFGNRKELIGDVLIIRNNYTLGISEENIISSLRNIATKLEVEENSIINQLKKQDLVEFKDKISRAFGILMHSYQIEAAEALNAISLLKLGLRFDLLKGIDMSTLNTLFLNTRRGHLLNKLHEKVDIPQIPHSRSEHIHSILKNVELTI